MSSACGVKINWPSLTQSGLSLWIRVEPICVFTELAPSNLLAIMFVSTAGQSLWSALLTHRSVTVFSVCAQPCVKSRTIDLFLHLCNCFKVSENMAVSIAAQQMASLYDHLTVQLDFTDMFISILSGQCSRASRCVCACVCTAERSSVWWRMLLWHVS